MKVLLTTLLASLLSLASVAAQAEEMFSNLGYLNSGGAGVTSAYSYAAQFTTLDTEQAYALDTVVMAMNATTFTNVAFSVSIYTNVNNQPGQLVEVLSGTSAPVHLGAPHTLHTQNYTYTSGGSLLLANTAYWVVAFNQEGGWTYWSYASDASSTDTHTLLSRDQGTSWEASVETGNMRFSVSATAAVVPEPATYPLLAGIAVLGLVCVRRSPRRG